MKTYLLGSAAVLAVTLALPAVAQVADPATVEPIVLADNAASAGDFADIVVTAQKRTERAVNVPITITAYTGKSLREIGVTQFDQLAAYVPGLNVQEQSPNNPGFVIRGITSDSGSSQGSPAVTIYLNGVDVSRSRGSYFDLYDLERVEVVKGPQATLFGTAAAIGAVSIITAKPTKEMGGELRVGYGNFDQKRVDGFFNTGGDVLSGRLAFAVKKRDGYVKNIAGDPGSQTAGGNKVADLNGQGQYGVRGSVRFNKGDVLIDAVATYDGQRAPGTAFKTGRFNPTGGTTSPYSPAEIAGSPYSAQFLGYKEPHLTRNVYDGNVTARWSPDGAFSFTQILGYRQFDSNEVFDADGTQAGFLEFAEDARGKQFSTESRVNYDSEHLRGFVGFNYFHETGSQRVPFATEEGLFLQCLTTLATPTPLIPGLGCINAAGVVTAAQTTALATGGRFTAIPYSSAFRNSAKIDTWSAFLDATWIPVPAIEITAGARVLIERRNSGFSAVVPNSVLSRAPLVPGQVDTRGQTYRAEGDFQAFLPRANLLWKVAPGFNLYGTYSRGRRSPVVQLDAAATPTGAVARRNDVAAEKVTNYEAGAKFARGPVSGSVGAFYQTYDNFQVGVLQTDGRTVTQSAGSATNKGIEAEFAAAIGEHLSLFANGAFINAKVDKSADFPTFSGDRFRLQSKYQAAAGGTVTLPLSESLELFATPTVTYRSRVFFELPNNPVTSQGAVTLVNLRAGLQSPGGKWQLLGYATNLANKKYLIDAGNTGGAFGIPTFIRAQPRLYGIEGVVRF